MNFESFVFFSIDYFLSLLKSTFERLPGRSEGEGLVREMERVRSEYEKYVASLEKEGSQRKELILTLELSELFYDAQLGECNILTTVGSFFIIKVKEVRAHWLVVSNVMVLRLLLLTIQAYKTYTMKLNQVRKRLWEFLHPEEIEKEQQKKVRKRKKSKSIDLESMTYAETVKSTPIHNGPILIQGAKGVLPVITLKLVKLENSSRLITP